MGGDDIVWEMRGPGGNTEPAERLEQVDAPGVEYGIVGYTHAGGVDRPLVAYKVAGGNVGAVVVPHMNWRGLFSMGTTESGSASTVPVEWPGFRTTAYHSKGETQESTTNWMGSLLEGQRDAGGLMYMRNRYYDPKTGQFTQTDPIGIAGGLNTYGFANGDPLGNWDPFGTCAWGIGPDAAFGRCSGMEPQDESRRACTRDRYGACVDYPATPEQWWRIGRQIRRIARHTPYCAGARSALLGVWWRGRVMFWDGHNILEKPNGEPEQIFGNTLRDRFGDYVVFDPRWPFRELKYVTHEGLHLHYRRHPPAGLDYPAVHDLIQLQEDDCDSRTRD